jgi:uncharacterized protein YprB with RNaseH-like and TPR domain
MSQSVSESLYASNIPMTIWLSNTITNITMTLIKETEIKMIQDTHIFCNERKIKHKYQPQIIDSTHFSHNCHILIENFKKQMEEQLKQVNSKNIQLTLNMNLLKDKPSFFHCNSSTNITKNISKHPRNILQISMHDFISKQLYDLQNDLIFFDIETDGLSLHSNILSICLSNLCLKPNTIFPKSHEEHLIFLKPNTNYQIDYKSKAYEINKITQEDIDNSPYTLDMIADYIINIFTKKIIVGFNINKFDIPILRNSLKIHNKILPPIKTIDLYQAHYKIQKHDLSTALKDLLCYPIDSKAIHQANADANACIRLLAACTEKLDLPTNLNEYLNLYQLSTKNQIFNMYV